MLSRLVNQQFKIIGLKITLDDIPDNGYVGKKKWYTVYRMTEEQEEEWRQWMWKELEGNEDRQRISNYTELRYGLNINYVKKGELF